MGARLTTYCVWLVATMAACSISRAADDATCQHYKELLEFTPAQVEGTMGQALGEDSRGQKYETTIRVNEYGSCHVYATERAAQKLYGVICEAAFDSNEFALFFVQSAKACLQDLLGKRDIAEVFHNERYWATKIGGMYFPGQPKGVMGGNYSAIRIEKVFDQRPDVTLYVYYFHG